VRRHRRMVLMDRVIPFLAAVVGLLALAGAVLVQITADTRTRETAAEVVALRESVDALTRKAEQLALTDEALAAADDDGTIDAMLALQERMNALESAWEARTVTASAGSEGGSFATAAGGAPAEIDPSWPTTDCIPLGTRFMASTGDSIAICKTPVVVKVSAITGDNVLTENAGVINETASQPIPGTNCSLMVFAAEAEGFAEMRVSCN
jgi:hypothetical protein